jgi:hypothetical protein
LAQPVVPLQATLHAVAVEHARPSGQGPATPAVHPPALLQVPAGVKVAFPEASVVHDAVPQAAPVSAVHVELQELLPLSADRTQVLSPVVHWAVVAPGQAEVAPTAQVQVESRLSAVPLQSLSFVAEEQSRGWAVTAPGHAVGQVAPVQVCVPGLQMPIAAGPHGRDAPSTQGHPSFGRPSQFASSPGCEQPSLAAGWTLQAPQWPAEQISMPWPQFPSAKVGVVLAQARAPAHAITRPTRSTRAPARAASRPSDASRPPDASDGSTGGSGRARGAWAHIPGFRAPTVSVGRGRVRCPSIGRSLVFAAGIGNDHHPAVLHLRREALASGKTQHCEERHSDVPVEPRSHRHSFSPAGLSGEMVQKRNAQSNPRKAGLPAHATRG